MEGGGGGDRPEILSKQVVAGGDRAKVVLILWTSYIVLKNINIFDSIISIN